MKKFIGALLMLILTTVPSFAADKATFQVGSVTLKSTSSGGSDSIAAVSQGNFINITIGGTKGTNAGTFTLLIPSSEVVNFEKGYKLDLTASGNDSDADNQALVSFLVTKIKINGFNSTTTSYATTEDSVATGTLTIASYNSDTGELKFNLNGKLSPYVSSKAKLGQSLGSETINKPILVKATVISTLDI